MILFASDSSHLDIPIAQIWHCSTPIYRHIVYAEDVLVYNHMQNNNKHMNPRLLDRGGNRFILGPVD